MSGQEETFKSFTPQQASQYARGRGQPYPPELYQAILDYHQGERHLLLDVGTGPGKVVFNLLAQFERAIGVDAAPEMIKQAQIDAESKGVSARTLFTVGTVEDLDAVIPSEDIGKVDVITAAVAAHWFDLPRFYAACARALQPQGTLAIWTCSGYYAHPTTPHHEEVQEALNFHENKTLAPYWADGNLISRGAYEKLPLPWTVEPAGTAFLESDFVRKDWDRNGIPSAPAEANGTPGPFLLPTEITPEMLTVALNAASAVVRWRQANPDKANGKEDPANMIVERLQELLGPGTRFVVSPSYTLLLFRKR